MEELRAFDHIANHQADKPLQQRKMQCEQNYQT